MRFGRRLLAALCVPPIALLTALSSPPVAAEERAATPAPGLSRTAASTVLRAGPAGAPSLVPADTDALAAREAAAAATFQVTYTGFTTQARAAFQRAVNVWAQRVNSPVPITVDARFEPLGTGVLGSAGANFVWRDFPGAPRAGTWYVDAIANKRAGSDLDPAADIVARFSSNFSNWHYGTGPAPAGMFDFTTVVLHELGHGLGFLGAGRVSRSRGTVRFLSFPFAYDRFTENGAGKKLLSFPNNSRQLADQLRSNKVFFDSPAVRNANGGARAKLYAPATWQQGSSYSHLDEATFPRGNPHSLMTPQIGTAETIRNPGTITAAIFRNIGW